ncbi:MAG: hypothetical protein ABMA02_11595 [Saprospiraceae bacterium]
MKKHSLILALLALATVGMAQQSNKSKSKDRYREKDTTVLPADANEASRLNGLRILAESELSSVVSGLSSAIQQQQVQPFVASRYFAYALLAGHETTARFQAKVSSFQETLRGMPLSHIFARADSVFHPFAALWAVLETGRGFFPSSTILTAKQAALEQAFREKGLDEHLIQSSKAASADIARSILAYAATDGFQQLATGQSGALRPFFLETTKTFALPAPAPPDMSESSPYLTRVRAVYDTGRNLAPEQRDIAEFWDTRENSLSGHWLAICGTACSQRNVPFNQALRTHTVVALAMADAYVVCRDDQSGHNREQPQAAINRSIDAVWRPLLSSSSDCADHGIVSAAAAEVLTKLIGDRVAVADTNAGRTRQHAAFREAAAEAAVSRLYGGLQFRDVLDAGLDSGRRLGFFVVQRLPVE